MERDSVMSNHHVRASEVKTFLDCRARWFARYVLGYLEPETISQLRGTAVHLYIENALTGKSNDDALSDVAALGEALLEHLPSPENGDLKVEQKFAEDICGIPCTGTIDLLQAATGSIWDHKTTSQQQYAKPEAELREDPQAIMYAAYATQVLGWSSATLQWNYVLTRGFPDVISTKVVFSAEQARLLFDKHIRPPYEEMKELRKQHRQGLLQIIADVPGNTASCTKYGGCPHRKYCAHASTIQDNKMAKSLAERAAERRAQQAQPPAEAQPAQSIIPPDAPTENQITEEDKKPRRRVASQGQLPVARAGQTLAEKIGAAAAPPPEQAPEQGTDFDVPPPEAPPPPVRRRAPQKPAEAPPAPEQAPAAPTPPPAPEPAAPTPEPAPTKKQASPTQKATPTTPAARIELLCIGCAPVQGFLPVYGSGIIEEAARIVEQEQNVAHYSLLSYGTGPSLVGQKVQQLLSTRQYGCVVLDARLDGRIIDAFASMAASIIRGFGTL